MLRVLYLDEALVAIDKPSGMVVHRGWEREGRVAMIEVRDLLGSWVYPVHRLDRATSGVLLFARSPEVAAALGAIFERHELEKRYLALVRGVFPEALDIDHPVPKAEDKPRVPARTRARRLFSDGRYSWVEATPETGRLHQIRRHLKHVSHPIIGDTTYGKGEHNRLWRERYGLGRMALHAAKLSLAHPLGGARLTLEAPLPDDLLGPLRAWSPEAFSSPAGSL